MKIICFGDSLTRGISFLNGRMKIIKKHYPNILQSLFTNNRENDTVVMNKGVFNDNSNLLLARIDKDVIMEQPDYVLINIGGNDCNFNWVEVAKEPNQEHTPVVPIERYAENVRNLVKKISSEGITPILVTLPPLDPVRYYENVTKSVGEQVSHWICRVGGIEHWHGLYNQVLIQIANELNVMCIDVRNAIKKAGDLTYFISQDGIHLTEAGYEILARDIYLKIAPIIQ